MGRNVHNTLKLKMMPSEARLKKFEIKKINILFMLIITVQIFSLCWQIFLCVRTKFPVFSLSGKRKNQIPCFPCFPCAVATLPENVIHASTNGARKIHLSGTSQGKHKGLLVLSNAVFCLVFFINL